MIEMVYPIFSLVILTFVVGICLAASRVISIRKKQVDPRYYKLLSGYSPPELVAKLGRNFSNLMEVPVLFYTFGALVIALGIHNSLMLGLAWVYVLTRMTHSIIHISYNNTIHRFLVFIMSNLVLLIMWIQLIFIIQQ